MTHPLNIVILAAGKGTRMKSDLPKVLHPLAGKPLISHVLAAADQLGPKSICVIYGHGGETLPQAIARPELAWARQEPQLGTGHAVQQAVPYLDPAALCLILYGDVPLTRPETLQEMTLIAGEGAIALLTVHLANPSGYGRIVRNARGQVERIVEQKDATPEELAINEVNTGILCLPAGKLAGWLARLNNKNAQGEYYLTDVIGMAAAEGERVIPCHPAAEWEVLGINSRAQLAELERLAAQLPPGFAFEWTGQSREEKLSGATANILFLFSLLAVFLCLAALYESWTIPLAVILVVPLGVLGVVLAAQLRGLENDVYFKVGLITIIGLSAKNAVLIIEFAKDLHAQGRDVVDAVLEAAHLRFRPILMTSLAFILGVLPLVMASGAGSASQRAIGTGVMGGMISATVLAVFFVPLFYVVVMRLFGRRTHAAAAPPPAPPSASTSPAGSLR